MPKRRNDMSKTKKNSKKEEKTTDLARIVLPNEAEKGFKVNWLTTRLPDILDGADSENLLKQATKVAKTALSELKTRKASILDPIALGLKNLRAEYNTACYPWEKVLHECRELVLEREARESKREQVNAQKRASRLEKAGKHEKAADTLSTNALKVHSATKELGVIRTWKAKITDELAIPVRIGQTILRPVDESVLNKLAREVGKGATITVPGVEFYMKKEARLG